MRRQLQISLPELVGPRTKEVATQMSEIAQLKIWCLELVGPVSGSPAPNLVARARGPDLVGPNSWPRARGLELVGPSGPISWPEIVGPSSSSFFDVTKRMGHNSGCKQQVFNIGSGVLFCVSWYSPFEQEPGQRKQK